jgi:hypothetical protein
MFVEDLNVFMNVAEFADSASLDGAVVHGLFDGAYTQAFDGMAATASAFTLASADCSTTTNASVLVHANKTYRVRSVQPDGTGISLLLLERTA